MRKRAALSCVTRPSSPAFDDENYTSMDTETINELNVSDEDHDVEMVNAFVCTPEPGSEIENVLPPLDAISLLSSNTRVRPSEVLMP